MKLTTLTTDRLFLDSDVIIFDDGALPESIIDIASGIKVSYLFIPKNDGSHIRTFHLQENVKFVGGGIFYCSNMVQQMSVNIHGNNITATLNLLALIQDNARIEIDGIGRVDQGSENIFLRVDQTNILLGENSIVRGRPVLEVATDSITGGHSCKIHKISGDDFFYLQSHGIDSSTVEGMLLSAEIKRHTAILEKHGELLGEELLSRLVQKNQSK